MIVWSTLLRYAYQADLSIGKPFGTRTPVPKSNLIDRNLPFSAVVGAGIGGTSCANFLREIFKDSAEIDVYEGNEVGGRLATVVMNDGNEYETGGSVIHHRNKYMSDFVSNLGWWHLCEPVVRSPSPLIPSNRFPRQVYENARRRLKTNGLVCTTEKISISSKRSTTWPMSFTCYGDTVTASGVCKVSSKTCWINLKGFRNNASFEIDSCRG